jgi:hypothetical protein
MMLASISLVSGGGAAIGAANAGQTRGGGGSSGAAIGARGTGQSVDSDVFCSTGVITPICK